MPAPASIISHGETGFRLRSDVPRRRARQIHDLEQTWCMAVANAFNLGDAPPDYPNMRIVEIEPLDTYESSSHALRINCEGFLGNETHIETSRRESQPEEGWDVLNLGIITRNPELARWMKGAQYQLETGATIGGYERMWITDRDVDAHRARDYFELGLTLKGLRYDKPFKRRINTTGQTVTNDEFPGIIISGVYSGFPPVPTGYAMFGPQVIPGTVAAEFDLPQISVTDTFVSTTPPPTELVPGYWIPSNAPTVNIITTSFQSDRTYHYPSGWKVLNLQSEQIPGQHIWLISLTWGYQIPSTPRSSG